MEITVEQFDFCETHFITHSIQSCNFIQTLMQVTIESFQVNIKLTCTIIHDHFRKWRCITINYPNDDKKLTLFNTFNIKNKLFKHGELNKHNVYVSSQRFYDFQLQERGERVNYHFTEREPGKTSENFDEKILDLGNHVSYIISIRLFNCFQTFPQLKSNVFAWK